MKMRLIYLTCLVLFACGKSSLSSQRNSGLLNPSGKDIVARFNTPEGFTRLKSDSTSFAFYLQHFPLKPQGSKVYYYNGEEKGNQVYEAVLDIDVGEKD